MLKGKVQIVLEQREVAFLSISLLKFKFLQILLGDKNATSLCSKNISTLSKLITKVCFKNPQKAVYCRKLRHFSTLQKLSCLEEIVGYSTVLVWDK